MSRQLIGSLLVALAIVAVTIAVVTAKLGPNTEESGDDSGKNRTEQRDDSGRGGDEED